MIAHGVSISRFSLIVCVLAVAVGFSPQHISAASTPFQAGDVFASVGDGLIQHYDAGGTLLETLDTGLGKGIFTTGCAFDTTGNLYVTTFNGQSVARFAGPAAPHANLGTFGSGYSGSPESIVFDSSGNAYVGAIAGDSAVRKFDGAGNPLGHFSVEGGKADWIDLAADQKTLFYTAEGIRILRYDVATSTQLPDFAPLLPGSAAYALRVLPDGGVLVADSEFVLRLDSAGHEVQRYDAPNEDSWFALNLDPDGKSFWSGDFHTGHFYKFDIATGNQVLSVDTGRGSGQLYGLCVFRELTLTLQDSDHDGIPDDWETKGIPGADLPAMGSDVNKKDIFVQIDWMQDTKHNYQPNPESIKKVVQAFANSPVDGHGINLHVDAGPDSIDYVTGRKWGSLGKGHAIPYTDILGNGTLQGLSTAVTALFNDGKPLQSDLVFHYAFYIKRFDSDCHSGRSLGTQVFIIALGCTNDLFSGKMTANEETGSFMHELGHNLGLRHGGDEDVNQNGDEIYNNKPNYLSVMNYSYQFGGLIIDGMDGNFDYSRFDTPTIDEAHLSESKGINGGPQLDKYGVKYHNNFPYLCGVSNDSFVVAQHANGSIDWSCNGILGFGEGTVQVDVNGAGGNAQTLHSYNDWDHLQYRSGNIGQGGTPPPIAITPDIVAASHVDPTPQYFLQIQQISNPRAVVSDTVAPATVAPQATVTYSLTLFNADASDVMGVSITATLPPGFAYQAGSTSGATTADPAINGGALVWNGPFSVPANGGALTLLFHASASGIAGTYLNTVSGSSINGIVIPAEDAAPVTVNESLAPPTLTVNPQSGLPFSQVELHGSGFTATAPISLTLTSGSQTLTPTVDMPVQTDTNGTFAYSFTIPMTAAGVVTLRAIDIVGTSASTLFTVTVPPTSTMTPMSTPTNTGTPTATSMLPMPTIETTPLPVPTVTPLPTVKTVPLSTPLPTVTSTLTSNASSPTSTSTPNGISLTPTGTATLQPTNTPIVIPGEPGAPLVTPSAGAISTATATVNTRCATTPFSFTQFGTVPTGTPVFTGTALSLAAGSTLLSPDSRFALSAPATLPAPLTVTFSSTTAFTLSLPTRIGPSSMVRLPIPLRVLLPTGTLLYSLEPSTMRFRAIYDKRGTFALRTGTYMIGPTSPVHFAADVASNVLALGNEPLTVCSGGSLRVYAATFPGAQVTISAFNQDQTAIADSNGRVEFSLTAPRVMIPTTVIYIARVVRNRGNGKLTTLSARQRFRVIPSVPYQGA